MALVSSLAASCAIRSAFSQLIQSEVIVYDLKLSWRLTLIKSRVTSRVNSLKIDVSGTSSIPIIRI
jgi:hypothetical protein